MPSLIGSTLGPYRVLDQIGLGGMAAVYKAYQPGMDRLVALKVLPVHFAREPRFVERFKQEARVIASLEHPGIVPVYDFGEQDGLTYLAMRYLQAGTLKDILAGGALPLEDAAGVLWDVAAALDHAHSQGIVHRDVKPSNILVDAQGRAYLTDFGIAKVLEGTAELTGSTLLGTPAYMAPEQTLGKPVSAQSDVYSLGVMLYEMVTGRTPFEAETPMAVALMHVHEPLPRPAALKPDLPPAVEAVILKALAKEPAGRYESAGALASAFGEAALPGRDPRQVPRERLKELAGQTAAGKGSEEVTYDLRQELRRRERAQALRGWAGRAPFIAGLLAVVILIIAVVWLGGRYAAAQGAAQSTDAAAAGTQAARQAATQTAAGFTPTPRPTATQDPVLAASLTAAPAASLAADAANTQAALLTGQTATAAAGATRRALTPLATYTALPPPTATFPPTSYVELWCSNCDLEKARPGRIALEMSDCWPSEAEARAAVELSPSLTVDGAPVAVAQGLGSKEIVHDVGGKGWCSTWPNAVWFVVNLPAGTYNLTWQWGSVSGSARLIVVNP